MHALYFLPASFPNWKIPQQFEKSSQDSCQEINASISSTIKLNLNVQNSFIKPLLKLKNTHSKTHFKALYFSQNVKKIFIESSPKCGAVFIPRSKFDVLTILRVCIITEFFYFSQIMTNKMFCCFVKICCLIMLPLYHCKKILSLHYLITLLFAYSFGRQHGTLDLWNKNLNSS